jgi:hypothetical protein
MEGTGREQKQREEFARGGKESNQTWGETEREQYPMQQLSLSANKHYLEAPIDHVEKRYHIDQIIGEINL